MAAPRPLALPKPVPAHAVRVLLQILENFGLKEEMVWICNKNFVQLAAVLRGEKSPTHWRARQELCVFLRRKRMSYTEIGKLLGIHHTTAIQAIRRAAAEDRAPGKESPATDRAALRPNGTASARRAK